MHWVTVAAQGGVVLDIPYSGYFLGGKIFVVFVVERQTTNFLPTKQYHTVPVCGLVYHNHQNFSTNWPKIHCSRKFYPPKNTHYTVFMYVQACLSKVVEVSRGLTRRREEQMSLLTGGVAVAVRARKGTWCGGGGGRGRGRGREL